MNPPSLAPEAEAARLEAVARYADAPGNVAFDEIVELSASICTTPIAAVTLLDATHTWCRSIAGMPAAHMPRGQTMCGWTVMQEDLFIIDDLRADSRFATSAMVANGLRFYAGAPLVTPDRQIIGALCVADRRPRHLNPEQRRALTVLSRQVVAIMELDRQARQLRGVTEALEEKRRNADAASEAKSRFLANMSHELRTPMNGVMTATELLLETRLETSQREDVMTIRKSAQGLVAILNDVLDVARIESGRLTLESEPVDLRALVKDVIAMLRPSAVAKDIALKASFDLEVPELVMGDALRLRQVLVNLVGNAVKFTAKGGISVDVRSSSKSSVSRTVLEIDVTDSGIGIAAEQREAIFESFVQAESSTTRRYGGTGLGLAIVRQLVEAMGGSVHVESASNGGSTFVTELSLVPCSPSGKLRVARAVSSARMPAVHLPRKATRVLLAEDDAINRKLVARLLEALGCEVLSVANGRAVVEAAKSRSFDLILMDVEMPELDGYGATVEVRRLDHASKRHTPIVALTAHVLPETRAACTEAGMDDYLSKPVGMADLQTLLESLPARSVPPGRIAG